MTDTLNGVPVSDVTSEEKLDAVHQVNQIWQKAAAMAPGPQREKFLRVANKVASSVAQAYDMPMEGQGPLDKVAAGGLKLANYGSDLLQAPVKAGLEAGFGPEGKWKDVLTSAVDPRRAGVSFGEVAKDIGIPPGPSLSDVVPGYAPPGTPGFWPPNKGGPLDPTARGAGAALADFGMSVPGARALSELHGAGQTLTAVEQQAVEKAAREAALQPASWAEHAQDFGSFMADPLSAMAEKGGRATYGLPFGNVDRMASEAGTRPVSDVLFKNNVWGTPSSIARQAGDTVKRLGYSVKDDIAKAAQADPLATVSRDQILSKALPELEQAQGVVGQSVGARKAQGRLIDEFNDAYGEPKPNAGKIVKKYAKALESDGRLPDDEFNDLINDMPGEVFPKTSFDINELQDVKQSMQGKAAQQRAYLNQPPNPSRGAKAGDTMVEAAQMGDAYKAVGNRARRGVENLADAAEPGLGGRIYDKNSDMASLLEGQDSLNKAADASVGSAVRNNWPSMIMGGMVGGSAASQLGHADPLTTALGTALGVAASSDLVRTGAGLIASKSAPWGTNAMRVYLNEKYNPWLREHQPFADKSSQGGTQ